jgi:TorA maturation chaperone TorD
MTAPCPAPSRAALYADFAALHGPADTVAATSVLNRAFCALFLGVNGPAAMAPPCESAYGDAGKPFQQPVADMPVLLAAHSLAAAGGWCEPEDHVAIELALAARLILAGANGAPVLARLSGWQPDFAARCGARDFSGFYAGITAMLHELLTDARDATPATLARPDTEMSQETLR